MFVVAGGKKRGKKIYVDDERIKEARDKGRRREGGREVGTGRRGGGESGGCKDGKRRKRDCRPVFYQSGVFIVLRLIIYTSQSQT